jgi:SAM-dependent methyltransferase
VDRLLEATRRAERDHFWFRGFRRFVTPILERASGGRRDLALLDCGCGTGANLALLGHYGQAVGIDLTMRGLRFARDDGRRLLARATVADLPFGEARFDLVTSFDVVYSLPDAIEDRAFGEMARVLKPGGTLIVTAAALPILKGNHSVLALEQRRYTKATLRRRLEGARLDVIDLRYTNASLVPMLLAVRLSQRALGFAEREEEATGEITVPWRPVNAALSAVLAMEARTSRFVPMPVGSSVVGVARK